MEELAGSRPAEHRCRVLSACGASVAALGRTGQWEGALRRFKLRQQLVFPDDSRVDFWNSPSVQGVVGSIRPGLYDGWRISDRQI